MTDRLEAIALTVNDRPIMSRDDEIDRLRGQRNELLDVCEAALQTSPCRHRTNERPTMTAIETISIKTRNGGNAVVTFPSPALAAAR